MKIRIELEDNLTEDEVIIRCGALDERIQQIQKAIADVSSANQKFAFYKEDTEYYLSMTDILFFETEDGQIHVHTADDMYQTGYKLYELEEMLPRQFLRVSKSTILNIDHVYSITKNLSASSVVQFENSHKQVYVSRHYYRFLRERLEEKRVKS